MLRKLTLMVLALFAVLYSRAYCKRADLQYAYQPELPVGSFEDFAKRKINFSLGIGVPERATEKLTINKPQKNGYAILYIHGFGATRAEGEGVADTLAASLSANIWYARLPGHGTGATAHAAATFDQYLQEMEAALLQMPKLGKKIIVIGTSTGALIATWLASRHSDKLHAVILASPFWDFGPKITRLLNFPGGLELAQLIMGKERDARWKKDPEKRVHADYEKYWLVQQKFSALVNLNNLRRFAARSDVIDKIAIPVLGLIYYKDETHFDDVIDIGRVRKLFPTMPNSKNKLVEIADGSHILLSSYVRSDKKRISAALTQWLETL